MVNFTDTPGNGTWCRPPSCCVSPGLTAPKCRECDGLEPTGSSAAGNRPVPSQAPKHLMCPRSRITLRVPVLLPHAPPLPEARLTLGLAKQVGVRFRTAGQIPSKYPQGPKSPPPHASLTPGGLPGGESHKLDFFKYLLPLAAAFLIFSFS